MKITSASTLGDIARLVSRALRDAGIRGVLTGGASASLHSDGEYVSHDLDYILQGRVTQPQLDEAMRRAGFERSGDRFVHPHTKFFVEFPRGPLAIGDDDLVAPVELRVGGTRILALSATDSCRDRLAAFYHWQDRQSLDVAVKIARRRRVDLAQIRRWSEAEGKTAQFEEFRRQLRVAASPRRRHPSL